MLEGNKVGEEKGAATRTALLIGVGDAPATAHRLPSLESVVAADLRVLKAALEGSGYRTVGVLHDRSRSEIAEQITAVSRRTEPGDTLLLYFTGHGVRIGATDYLVPADARGPLEDSADWDQPYIRDSLLDADISRYLQDCRANTVLWVMDACRSAEAEGGATFGSRITQGPPGSRFVVMTGCGPGERSGYASDGSLFTSALARAFDPLSEATTVEEVYRTAYRLTGQASRSRRGQVQEPQIYCGNDRDQETRGAVVAEGRRLLTAWTEAVHAPELWALASDAEAADVTALQEGLTRFVESVARQVDRAQKRLPDPWADDGFPVRLLRDRLPQLVSKDAGLSALEVAGLAAAVFVHEAAWAGRLSQAAELGPHSVQHDLAADEPRRYYQQILEQYPQAADKIRGYRRGKGVQPELDATVLWLVNRWIAGRFETDEQAVPVALGGEAAALLLGDVAGSADRRSGRAEELAVALRAITAGLSPGHRTDHGPLTFPDRHLIRGRTQPLRVRPLAALVRLAGLLALDARTLPDVLSEHLAVSDSVLPREVLTVLEHAYWDVDDRGDAVRELQLDAVCPHPAIHAALAAVVEEADELVQTLTTELRSLPAAEAGLLAGLPSRVTDSRLRPAGESGRRAYDVPLLRFSLAQTEVRRLLMGEQLYGGRHAAALRELYQNAMDACRYRAMRERYLNACGRSVGRWAGSIRIVTGEDERGCYIECTDNGVGMTVEQLKGTFTRAGRRFEQSSEFRREQAAWLRQDEGLRLYPNSRFGIGVFSYFMLADEMTITTRPVGPDGRPAPDAMRVDIAGSGSLFRIRQADAGAGAALAEGGTAVRLYLKPDRMTGDACVEVLRSVVYVSEFFHAVRPAGAGADCPTSGWAVGSGGVRGEDRPRTRGSAEDAGQFRLARVEGSVTGGDRRVVHAGPGTPGAAVDLRARRRCRPRRVSLDDHPRSGFCTGNFHAECGEYYLQGVCSAGDRLSAALHDKRGGREFRPRRTNCGLRARATCDGGEPRGRCVDAGYPDSLRVFRGVGRTCRLRGRVAGRRGGCSRVGSAGCGVGRASSLQPVCFLGDGPGFG
ncbi:caspase family protein [Kitasatospora sp. NPDC057541]|uniref:HD domain-containing protein n=1 Tax=unclassified Kitasatospora TaxID=2633591 RepID=UPI0036B0C9CB